MCTNCMNHAHKLYAVIIIIIVIMFNKIKAVHFRLVPPQEDTIAKKEKISNSFLKGSWMLLFLVLSCLYRKIVHKNNVFLAVILAASMLTLIPPAYAIFPDDLHKENVSFNDKSINLSDELSFFPIELLIKVKSSSKNFIKEHPSPENTGIASLNSLNKKHGALKFEQVAKPGLKSKKDSPLFNWYRVTFDAPEKTISKKLAEFGTFKETMDFYKSDPNIEAAEPDYAVAVLSTPNDPYYISTGSWNQSYPDLWGIRKINPETAWNQTTGSTSIIVAGIDTGVDRNHEDIKDNMWVNIAEIPNNGIDDDANGYIDDYYGWDWANNDNDPMDDHGHGTHTAGTIAAVGNNGIGVVGVNWKSRIMALKFLDSSGGGFLSDGIKALQYAADMGASVSSNSWGCGCNSIAMDDAVQYEHDKGMVIAAAAGNSNIDALDFSPASADMAITVAASDYTDAKASFSNWGQKIDVAAPGVKILSAKASINNICTASSGNIVGTNYCIVSGTSMATPHVAGLASLILSKNPTLTNEEVRQIIRTGADDLGTSGKDSSFGYGRINAANAIALNNINPLSPIITSPISRTLASGASLQIKGSIPGPNFASYKIEMGAGRAPSTWTTIVTSTTQVIDGALATIDATRLAEGTYIFRLTATDTNGKTYQFQVNDITVDNFDVVISFPMGLVSLGSIDVIGTAQTRNGLPFNNYKLEWGVGSAPTSWSTAGITLVNGGLQPVVNDKLATWNTSSLTDKQTYSLRLTVNSTIRTSYPTYITAVADRDLVKGWPKAIPYANVYPSNSPTLADLDGDGVKEVIVPGADGKLYVYRKDGSGFPGFPVGPFINSGDFYNSGVTVDDIDNDGKKEIITTGNRVYIIRSDGTPYPGWPQPALPVYGTVPSIADLDGDGKKDMVAIDVHSWVSQTVVNLHAFHLNGSELAGFPKSYTLPPTGLGDNTIFPFFSGYGQLSITDLDGDGKPEIAWSLSNRIYLFDNTGNILPGWPFIVPNYNNYIMMFEGSLASGDVEGDGQKEIFAISDWACLTNAYACYGAADAVMYGWKKDGSVLPGWPKTSGSDGFKSTAYVNSMYGPVFTDVDNDGRDEIIIGGWPFSIFDVEGKKSLITPPSIYTQPTISDLDGNGKFEIAGGWYNTVHILKDDGSTYWTRSASGAYFNAPGVFADLDNDDKMEYSIISPQYGQYTGVSTVYLWEIPNNGGIARYDWPTFSHDPARTGRLYLTNKTNQSDTIPPITSIISPSNGSTVSGTITVQALASDNIGVTRVELYSNGMLLATDTASPFTFAWNTAQSANGLYTLQTRAYDAANNRGASSSITENVNNIDIIQPLVAITNPSDGSTVMRRSAITITASASDNTGIAKVEFYVDNILQCSGTGYQCIWNVPGKQRSIFSLQAKAYDVIGNVGTSAIVIVTSR